MTTNTIDREKPVILICGVDRAAEENHHLIAGAFMRSRARTVNVRDIEFRSYLYVRKYVPRAKALLVHTSSAISLFGDQTELKWIKIARRIDLPIFSVADTHFGWARPEVGSLAKSVKLFVASPSEVAEATTFGYESPEYIGGPPLWGSFRMQDGFYRPEDKVFFVGGLKSPKITDEMLEVVVRGIRLVHGDDFGLIFRPHPKEDSSEDIKSRREAILLGVRQIPVGSSELHDLARSEVSFFTSGATGVIAAGINRLPTAYYLSDSVDARMMKSIGRKDWTPVSEGATVTFRSPEDVKGIVDGFLNVNVSSSLRGAQAKVYPDGLGVGSAERIVERILQELQEIGA